MQSSAEIMRGTLFVSHANLSGVKMTRGSTVPSDLVPVLDVVPPDAAGPGFLSVASAKSTASFKGFNFFASFDAAIDSRAEMMRIPDTSELDPGADTVLVDATLERRPALVDGGGEVIVGVRGAVEVDAAVSTGVGAT